MICSASILLGSPLMLVPRNDEQEDSSITSRNRFLSWMTNTFMVDENGELPGTQVRFMVVVGRGKYDFLVWKTNTFMVNQNGDLPASR